MRLLLLSLAACQGGESSQPVVSPEAPEIRLDPDVSGFTTFVGCTETEVITISNVGTADLVVTDLDYVSVGTDFTFDADEAVNGALPWTLAPSESRDVYYTYDAVDEEADEAILQVTSTDPLRPEAAATQSADGTIYGENLDTFELNPMTMVDVLFVVDNSAGEATWEARTVASADSFIDALAGEDYQIAVIPTDNPAFVAEVITPATGDPSSALADALAVGAGGSGNEMPSEMAFQSMGSDDGAEFLRAGAGLAMVFISHEPDSSPSAWSDYLEYFQTLPDRPEDFIAHAISGDWPTGCSTASATNNVYEMTVATGGLYLSICEPTWDDHMESIVAETIVHSGEFQLSEWPVPATIEVWLDGVLLEGGWAYNEADRAITFDEGVLPEVGTLEVRYVLPGDCED